jgi:tRNA isopentenyl-2-thiomethyl-A-37 hydroxylase MiaE
MMQNTSLDASRTPTCNPVIDPSTARELVYFGAAPLEVSEDEDTYNRLLTRVFDCLEPTDIMEMMWVRDIVDSQWEIDRCSRVKANLIEIRKYVESEKARDVRNGVSRIPKGTYQSMLLDHIEAERTKIDRLAAEAIEAASKVNFARAVALELNELERLDRMIMNAQARRDNAYFRLEKRRAAVVRGPATPMQDETCDARECDNHGADLEVAA